jgi:hypothetical protein
MKVLEGCAMRTGVAPVPAITVYIDGRSLTLPSAMANTNGLAEI